MTRTTWHPASTITAGHHILWQGTNLLVTAVTIDHESSIRRRLHLSDGRELLVPNAAELAVARGAA